MPETPDQMLRRVLRERYPRPQMPVLTRALLLASLPLTLSQSCRLCGCWGGHEDGCVLGER